MLSELLVLAVTSLHVIGLLLIMWGVFSIIAGVLAGQGAFSMFKGAVLMGFGSYISGLGQVL